MPKTTVFTRKNIVVLGGAGFIGSHLCDDLVKKHNVICIDNFVSGSQFNINHLLPNPNFVFVRNDLYSPINLENLPELAKFSLNVAGVQEVYNLACPTSAKEFDKYKIDTLVSNSYLMKNSLDLAVKYRAKYLFTSSAVVYGPRKEGRETFLESYYGEVNFMSPRACYDEGKRFAESMVATYRDVYDLDTKIARIFRTYGPRMKLFDGQMIPDFIVNALDNKDLVIYGDKTFSTVLVYVSEVVDGLIRLMESDLREPVNIGGTDDYKIVEVANKIIEMMGSKSKIVFVDPLLFMTPLGLPDISLAKEKLGWFPVVLLKEGLQRTIDYTKANKILITNVR